MTENTEDQVHEEGYEEHYGLFELARKVLLASIGAVALAQEEAEAFVKKLIERGEIAEKDGHRLIDDMRERRKKKFKEGEWEPGKRMDALLERAGVPSKSDIEALSEKISALTEKVEELIKSEEA
jgi:poly(hydroxyalkanoate) granule-associated protein